MGKKLYRSDDAVVGGVCAGLAEHFDIDPIIVRILAVVLGFSSLGIVLFVYVMLWIILPKRPSVQGPIEAAADVPAASAEGEQESASADGLTAAAQPTCEPAVGQPSNKGAKCAVWVGVSLLIVGFAGVLGAAIGGISWWQMWPLSFMLGAIALMILPGRPSWRGARIACGLILFCVGFVSLCCSTGLLSWRTVGDTLQTCWPLFMVVAGLIMIGSAIDNSLLIIAAGLVFFLMCIIGLTVYAVPGATEFVYLQLPFMEPRLIDINPWI